MVKRKVTIITKIVAGVLLLVLFVGAMNYIFKETDNLTIPGTFYVEVDGERISNNKNDYVVLYGNEYRFDVGYAMDMGTSDDVFIVEIVPNISDETSFDFMVGNEIFAYEGLNDLSAGFNLKIYDGYFTIHPTMELENIIQTAFPDKTVSGIPGSVNSEISYYKLIISNEDRTSILEITFQLAGRIILDKYEVMF